MDTVEIVSRSEPINEANVIDDASLIKPLISVRSPYPRETACVTNPPLTLYGAYRHGVDDYFAWRTNTYRASSRFWAVWEEGRIEAETERR
ncbi:hypothetical protein [Burkholderia pyrrocinia]